MGARSFNDKKEEIDLEVELLNQACLDLVAQIEELKRENVRLKQMQTRKQSRGSGQKHRTTTH